MRLLFACCWRRPWGGFIGAFAVPLLFRDAGGVFFARSPIAITHGKGVYEGIWITRLYTASDLLSGKLLRLAGNEPADPRSSTGSVSLRAQFGDEQVFLREARSTVSTQLLLERIADHFVPCKALEAVTIRQR